MPTYTIVFMSSAEANQKGEPISENEWKYHVRNIQS